MTVSDSQHSDLILEKLDELSECLLIQKQKTQESAKLLANVLQIMTFSQIKTNCLFEALAESVGISADKWGEVKYKAVIQAQKIALEKNHQTN